MNDFTPNSRYVLPSFEEQTAYGMKRQDPYAKLFEDRIIFLGTQIDEVSADDVMAQLLVLEGLDADRDITLYINSAGGSLQALAAIYDTMEFISNDVITVCLGEAGSAAAILLAAGAPGKRHALPNSRVMIQQPSSEGMRGQASDIEIRADEALRNRSWIEGILSHHTGQPLSQVSIDVERDKFLTAEAALQYGIIDTILPSRKKSRLAALKAA